MNIFFRGENSHKVLFNKRIQILNAKIDKPCDIIKKKKRKILLHNKLDIQNIKLRN